MPISSDRGSELQKAQDGSFIARGGELAEPEPRRETPERDSGAASATGEKRAIKKSSGDGFEGRPDKTPCRPIIQFIWPEISVYTAISPV